MTSTRRRPEEPDDDSFTLQRKRFRVTKPSSQQSGATAAERPIPVRAPARPQGGCLRLRGATEDAAATLQEVADGQPRGIVLARREPSRRGVLVGYPTGLPLDPVLEHPLVVTAVWCSYSAGLKRHLPTRQVQLTPAGARPRRPGPWLLRDFRGAQVHPGTCPLLPLPGVWALPAPVSAAARAVWCVQWGARFTELRPPPTGGWRAARGSVPQLRCQASRLESSLPCPAPADSWVHGSSPAAVEGGSLASTSVFTPAVPRNEDAAKTRRPRRRRRRKRPQRSRLLSPVGDMDVDAQAPVMTQVPAPLEMAAIGGKLQLAVAPRHDAATQSYEFLVSQESVAIQSRVSHQPAFSYVRQALREGRSPGMQLPTESPINVPAYHRRRNESDWVSYDPAAGSH
ncbi:hypothetical protein GWK47_017365 [Chionoecetes opilio]|uniref:Uncharacterized protein n=1 Tax=Chionoecetes opilio TaxID=41210 RepID=A0A8J4XRV6_CHIOP|nr:hypothetical protein GWK47_017365 [Chionoecetes opilio]